jgi:hypothetical protein
MFQFYTNLLYVDAKYVWNKIVQEQTQSNPHTDLQGISKKGPRGPSCKSFDDCVMFHLLTMFPSNATEKARYYLTCMLKKPQNIRQLNSYIVQLPFLYYSPSVNSKTTLANV